MAQAQFGWLQVRGRVDQLHLARRMIQPAGADVFVGVDNAAQAQRAGDALEYLLQRREMMQCSIGNDQIVGGLRPRVTVEVRTFVREAGQALRGRARTGFIQRARRQVHTMARLDRGQAGGHSALNLPKPATQTQDVSDPSSAQPGRGQDVFRPETVVFVLLGESMPIGGFDQVWPERRKTEKRAGGVRLEVRPFAGDDRQVCV